jgi:hypothetical protein
MNNLDASAWGPHVADWFDNKSTAVQYSIAATSKVGRLPAEWGNGGYWVRLSSISTTIYFLFSKADDAEVAVVAGTDAGAKDATSGSPLMATAPREVKVPPGCVYFARIAADESSTGTVTVELSSDPLGT